MFYTVLNVSVTFNTVVVSRPVILFAILAARAEDAGGNSPITVLRPGIQKQQQK